MIYTPLTQKAMQFAYQAHHGQVDKSGQPYIFHPYHIAEQMEDEKTVCVALLHDILEDTGMTVEQLEQEFPEDVVDAVKLLTKSEQEEYLDYIKKIKENPIARKVKLEDLEHNSDETRMIAGTKEERRQMKRRKAKYQKAKKILEEL